MYRILLKASAQKDLDGLPAKSRKKVSAAIDELSRMGVHARHTKKLKPPIGGYRTRIGGYRVLFDYKEGIVLIHRISKRSSAY